VTKTPKPKFAVPKRKPRGLCCPACNSTKIPALYTRRKGKESHRVRKCRDCGERFTTSEMVVNHEPPSRP